MSRKGALKLHEYRRQFKIQADGWNLFMRAGDLKVVVLKEMAIEHDVEALSSIGEHSPMIY